MSTIYPKRSSRFGKPKKRKYLKYLLIILLIGGAFLWYQYSKYQYFIETPVDPTDSTNITFIIKEGDTINQITNNLSEKNLIVDKDAFKQFTKLNGIDRKIIAGRFILQRQLTIPEVVEVITDNTQGEEVLTIPEGSTVLDIDSTLAGMNLIEQGEFTKAVIDFDNYQSYPFLDKSKMKNLIYPLEGYLFPDTYFLDPINFHSENLIQLMLDNFENKLGDEIGDNNDRSFNDIIIMASIVEKEVRTNDDIPIVAGILWKRLDENWLLGADATLLYLADDRILDYQDLQEESDYNTRINQGLPPGPICNPGLKHILATIHPEESSYYYYLTTLDTGEVIYAKSNDEHNQNKRKYLY